MTATAPTTAVPSADGLESVARRRRIIEGAVLGLVVGVLVIWPWTSGGYLLLLDWVSGPNQTLTPGVFGLSGSALDALPFRLATQGLRNTIGPQATAWLLILMFFPLAAAGIAAASGGSRWRFLPASTLMVCNPWVVDRVRAGHVALLLGVALLPWLMAAARDARQRGAMFSVRPALWYALAISMSPHAAWLGGAVLIAMLVTPRPTWRDAIRTVQIFVTAGLVYSYALVLWLTGTRTLRVTEVDLSAYQTLPGPGGLMATVLSLHGFWRGGTGQVRDLLGPVLGILLLVVILAAVVVGLARLVDLEPTRGRPLVVLTILGILLGAGVLGPLGWLYRLAFAHLPLFEAMREQQKWLALALLGYSIGFGAGVEWLAARARSRARAAGSAGPLLWPVAVAGAIPLVMAPALLWGLGGSVSVSKYPAGWAEADAVMGAQGGSALFLPWHAYQPFEFTGGRAVATPARAFFRREIISSDAVELPQLRTDSTSLRMEYLDRVIAHAGEGAFGRLVAPLGVEYVLVSKEREAAAYDWVGRQPGLTLVLRTDSLDVYRVEESGVGRVVTARTSDYDRAVAQALNSPRDTAALLRADGPVADGASSRSSGDIQKSGPTSWTVGAGPSGWVVLPEEWSEGWQMDGRSGRPTVAGTIAFEADELEQDIEFVPWRYLLPALLVSLFTLVVLIGFGIATHRQQVQRMLRPDEPAPDSQAPMATE